MELKLGKIISGAPYPATICKWVKVDSNTKDSYGMIRRP